MLILRKDFENSKAKSFCQEFIHSDRPKYIFGRNEWAESTVEHIEIHGFIDDFTEEKEYLYKPIIPIDNIPPDALVVVAVIGKPSTAEKRVRQYQFQSLDYYSFFKYSGLPLKNIMFWDGMIEDLRSNFPKYTKIYALFQDNISKNQFYNILNFRNSYDLDYMRGFSEKEDQQYFEDFLNLKEEGEIFVDIGGYEGYTTEEFIRRCPKYKEAFFFEPESNNMLIAKKRLERYRDIHYFPLGLSDRKEILRFTISGSSSKISDEGELTIQVDRLDDLIDQKITFLKMDIEGAERSAIEGAKNLIRKYHPKLAVSVYHRKDDFWKIPEQILNIRSDYKIYLRHYTEGMSETIMFFVPTDARRKLG
ncbi:FkbM family methyltransferase [Nitratifractor sp.]|uniref:FkbM family methyltransferase n=1 Tax=Nitratifractor sp. TaxID=2268144 RepID=UPI0025E0BA4B|nr:FkbM family methyltransferase [Nitratifractor sp.]